MKQYKPKGRPPNPALNEAYKSEIIEFIKSNPKTSYYNMYLKTRVPFSVAWFICKKLHIDGIISINSIVYKGRAKTELEYIYK